MKKIKWILAILSAVVILKFALASNLESITPKDAENLQKENKAIIVDVREPEELKAGKIKGAIELPLSWLEKDKNEFEKLVATFPKDKKILVYCRSGRRSGIVGEELLKRKFQVYNLGGFENWKSQGLPTE